MTITSTNHNPGNDSQYARHRLIWKGKHNQLRDTIARLQGTSGMRVFEYTNNHKFYEDWGVRFSADRLPPTKRSQILGRWSCDPPSRKMLAVLSGKLAADLSVLWDDFIVVGARRIGSSDGVGSRTGVERGPYTGTTVIVFAYGPQSFDLIISKYGFGAGNQRNHHFYQWQARTTGFEGLVHVDDYEGEEGLTFYVVS
ncbi:MAG: hypothetical protein ABSC95_07825 [Acetobacteraceae bacterium]